MALSPVCENSSPVCPVFYSPGQRSSIPTNLLPVTWLQGPSATALLLPCHLQALLGFQGVPSLDILLTLPRPVISRNQLFSGSVLFSFSWPHSWQIDTSYTLTQLQQQWKGLCPLHLCLPWHPLESLGMVDAEEMFVKVNEFRELVGNLERLQSHGL